MIFMNQSISQSIGLKMLNDRRTQEMLYKQYYASMFRLAMVYTVDPRDGQEIVNDAFLKVFLSIDSFKPEIATFYTWMRRILINTALDYRKKHKTFLELDENFSSVSNTAVGKLNWKDVLRSLTSLPERTARVFNLYHFEGYSHKEIGLILGISSGTSRWFLSEGKKLLK